MPQYLKIALRHFLAWLSRGHALERTGQHVSLALNSTVAEYYIDQRGISLLVKRKKVSAPCAGLYTWGGV